MAKQPLDKIFGSMKKERVEYTKSDIKSAYEAGMHAEKLRFPTDKLNYGLVTFKIWLKKHKNKQNQKQ